VQELIEVDRSCWAKREKLSAWEWAEKNVTLSGATPYKGPYRTSYTPYVRGVLDALEDWRTHTVVLAWGSQTAKTTSLMVWLNWRQAKHPPAALWVMPTEALARSFSESRLQPMFRSCSEVAQAIPEDSDRWKILEMHWTTGNTINLVGSNSPAAISSRPVEVVVCDELDKFAPASEKEAAAFALALERTKAFPRRKHVLTSTPTLATGDIWIQYLAGTREKYFVPCPHCSEMQELVFGQVKWDEQARGEDGKWDLKKVRKTAHYLCEKCGEKIDDGHKTAMLRAGEWRATAGEDSEPGRRSFHLNSLYSPSITYADAAVKFLTEKNYLQGLQNFVNGWLALPWEDQFDDDEAAAIPPGAFAKKQPWDKDHILLAAIDRQIDEYWYVIRAFARDGTSRLFDEGRRRTIEDVAQLMAEHRIQPRHVAIDSGYETQDTYRIAARYGWTAIKGEERPHFLIEDRGMRIKSVHSSIQPTDAGCQLLLLSSPGCQDLLAWLRRGQGPMWEVAHDVSPEYREHMASHKKVHRVNRKTGKDLYEWIRVKHRPDHLYDCETYLAGFAVYGKVIAAEAAMEKPDA
jgi:phage terminase large subunit GpA-like protein